MKLEYMKEFIKLADSLNITTTSESLFISQSTLSRHIKAMESELGYPILITSSHGIRLTDEGEDSLKTFREIVHEYDALLSRNKPADVSYSGTLRFGMLYYLLDEGYIEFIEMFEKKYPKIRIICMSNYQPHNLYDDLIYGKIDVATMPSYRGSTPENLRFQKTEHLPSIVMVKESHPLASQDSVRLSELTEMPIVQLKLDEFSYKLTQKMLEQNHFHANTEVFADNIETVPFKIRRVDGFHITGDKCRKQQAQGIAYLPLADKNTSFELGVMAIARKDILIDLFFQEIRQFFMGRHT